jgi:hypothetical protein
MEYRYPVTRSGFPKGSQLYTLQKDSKEQAVSFWEIQFENVALKQWSKLSGYASPQHYLPRRTVPGSIADASHWVASLCYNDKASA